MKSLIFDSKIDRQSNIELLRIVSMIMIVFHHFAVHGGFDWKASDITFPHFWYNLIAMGGKIGVDVFILISGYFLIMSHSRFLDLKRIFRFWGQIIFYSISIFIIFSLFRVNNYGIKLAIKSIFPITFSIWKFASTYFVLYIFHPYLNLFLNGLKKKYYQTFLLMLVIIWSVIPTFTPSDFQGNDLCWFVTLYAIAGYIRLYGFNRKFTTKIYFLLWGIFSGLTYFSSIVLTILGTKSKLFLTNVTYFYGAEKLSVLLISLTLFMGFATLKMNYHKWINTLASATFGVYLIHDHSIVRDFLWIDIFKNAQYQNSVFLIPYSIIVVLLVYVICTAIDLLRKKLLEKPFMFFVNKYADYIIKPIVKIVDLCRTIIFG